MTCIIGLMVASIQFTSSQAGVGIHSYRMTLTLGYLRISWLQWVYCPTQRGHKIPTYFPLHYLISLRRCSRPFSISTLKLRRTLVSFRMWRPMLVDWSSSFDPLPIRSRTYGTITTATYIFHHPIHRNRSFFPYLNHWGQCLFLSLGWGTPFYFYHFMYFFS